MAVIPVHVLGDDLDVAHVRDELVLDHLKADRLSVWGLTA